MQGYRKTETCREEFTEKKLGELEQDNDMIYELKDLSKVEPLFGDWVLPELKDWDGLTIRIFVTDPDAPRSAMLLMMTRANSLQGSQTGNSCKANRRKRWR